MVVIKDIRNQTATSQTKRSEKQITKIARHHSATTSGDYFSFWNHWKSKGWTKGGYHEIILPDGTVQLCYDAIYPTNGIANHNTNTYHICVVGNGAFTAVQERTFEERCLLAMNRFNLTVEDVLGHNEFKGASTSCPGINMAIVRKRLKSLLVPSTDKIMWGKTELKPGQKGKITVLQDINVWEDSPHASGEIVHTRTLKAGGEFRVYNFREEHGGQYYLGAGEWVTKMPDHILYETPSKAMLEKLNNN
ncbi:peptidoglycan recognition family protein [Psychrobacillus sp.]|uniref:peptidoglycan recognition protein family protein n=1 Tax=Psychrobacillus sp. TaxID=1871623 RepID=UPI0028BDED4C|nr:peptidoglycan recognition family protein [Psychrobacillus sp.]